MGGRGSGNWRRSGRATCESCYSISISTLRAHGLLKPGASGTLTWSRHGETTGSTCVENLPAGLQLTYRTQHQTDGAWVEIKETIPWAASGQHFGGRRLWFSCLGCQKRCGVLYGGQHYRCRKCWNLSYESQRQELRLPAARKIEAIRKRLGAESYTSAALPERPKGMHHRTYEQLCGELQRATEVDRARLVAMTYPFAHRGKQPPSVR